MIHESLRNFTTYKDDMSFHFNIQDDLFLPHLRCDVSFPLERKEVKYFKGENGIGKSTLFRSLSLKYKHLICLIEQEPLDYFFNRPLSRVKKYFLSYPLIDSSLFQDLWSDFKLDQKENHRISFLSGGEKQVLKLCLGLSVKKDIFLLDEPHQYLDLQNRKKLHQVIKTFLDREKSFLVIEHSDELMCFQGEIYFLNQKQKTLIIEDRR